MKLENLKVTMGEEKHCYTFSVQQHRVADSTQYEVVFRQGTVTIRDVWVEDNHSKYWWSGATDAETALTLLQDHLEKLSKYRKSRVFEAVENE